MKSFCILFSMLYVCNGYALQARPRTTSVAPRGVETNTVPTSTPDPKTIALPSNVILAPATTKVTSSNTSGLTTSTQTQTQTQTPILTPPPVAAVVDIGTHAILRSQALQPVKARTIEYIAQPRKLVSAVTQSVLILNHRTNHQEFAAILRYSDEEVLSELNPAEAAARSREIILEVLKKPVDHVTLGHTEHLLMRSVEYHAMGNQRNEFISFLNLISRNYPHHFNYIAENLDIVPPATVLRLQVRAIASEPFIQGSR